MEGYRPQHQFDYWYDLAEVRRKRVNRLCVALMIVSAVLVLRSVADWISWIR